MAEPEDVAQDGKRGDQHSWFQITVAAALCVKCGLMRRTLISQDSRYAMTEYVRLQGTEGRVIGRRAGECYLK